MARQTRIPTRPTIPDVPSTDERRRARAGRRIVMGALALVILAAGVGLLGVRTATKTVSGGGFDVTVTYAAVTRPGLATPFDVEVTRTAGRFVAPVTVAVNADFLAAFDENGLDPDPTVTRADADFVYWTLEIPPSDTLGVSFDARLEPAVQWKRDGIVRLIRQGKTLAEVDFTMWVVP